MAKSSKVPPAQPRPKAKKVKKAKKAPALTALQALERALHATRFDKRYPHLRLQIRRLGKLLAIQHEAPDQEFPEGTCFLHAVLPTTESFCLRSLLEVDLDAASIICAIYGDDVLAAGHVILPMESIAWIGFPDTQVNVGVRFAGFHLPNVQKKPLLVKKPKK
jgi:hypothetical protein